MYVGQEHCTINILFYIRGPGTLYFMYVGQEHCTINIVFYMCVCVGQERCTINIVFYVMWCDTETCCISCSPQFSSRVNFSFKVKQPVSPDSVCRKCGLQWVIPTRGAVWCYQYRPLSMLTSWSIIQRKYCIWAPWNHSAMVQCSSTAPQILQSLTGLRMSHAVFCPWPDTLLLTGKCIVMYDDLK
jgi:hypothetical protein